MTHSTPSDLPIFSSAPDTRLFQAFGAIESCREQLEAMLRTDAGLGLLIGPPGTGKSLLCQVLAETLRDPFEVVLLAESAPRDQLSLLQNILFHLNMPYKNVSEGELRLSLIDRLTQNVHSRDHGLVLIVDEAQSLPNSILEEIRMITNIVRGGRSCVRTVLAGNHELEDRISQPGLESLAQRVAVRCYLHPFNQADTGNYLRATLAAAETAPSIDDEAVAAIHFATGGVPRLIAQMMRQVLPSVAGETIHVEHVNQAWARSQQLASPVLEPELREDRPAEAGQGENVSGPHAGPANDIVEFGELSCGTDAVSDPGDCLESLELENQAEPPAAPQSPAAAENMPEIAAQLDRVTDSLLRISEQRYDESQPSADSVAPQDTFPLQDLSGPFQLEDNSELEDNSQLEDNGELEGTSELDETWDLEDLPDLAATAGDCELEVDTTVIDASAQWSSEELAVVENEASETSPPPATPLVEPQALFGDGFDEEESIPGLAASTRPGTALPIRENVLPTTNVLPADENLPAENDLPVEPVAANHEAEEIDDACQPEHDLHSEVACISVEASTIQLDRASLPPAAAIGTDGVGSREPLQDDICLNDDSDMLIIEDVIDVEPAPVRGVVFDDDPTDSVDYQRLLNRMRQG